MRGNYSTKSTDFGAFYWAMACGGQAADHSGVRNRRTTEDHVLDLRSIAHRGKASLANEEALALFRLLGERPERGWSELEPRYAWAAARFVSGEFAIEDLASNTSGDLGYTVWIERRQAKLRGVDGQVTVALRVTHIYRNESGTWRMVHRHADPIVSIPGTEAVIEARN